jgi:hypothetical protein
MGVDTQLLAEAQRHGLNSGYRASFELARQLGRLSGHLHTLLEPGRAAAMRRRAQSISLALSEVPDLLASSAPDSPVVSYLMGWGAVGRREALDALEASRAEDTRRLLTAANYH